MGQSANEVAQGAQAYVDEAYAKVDEALSVVGHHKDVAIAKIQSMGAAGADRVLSIAISGGEDAMAAIELGVGAGILIVEKTLEGYQVVKSGTGEVIDAASLVVNKAIDSGLATVEDFQVAVGQSANEVAQGAQAYVDETTDSVSESYASAKAAVNESISEMGRDKDRAVAKVKEMGEAGRVAVVEAANAAGAAGMAAVELGVGAGILVVEATADGYQVVSAKTREVLDTATATLDRAVLEGVDTAVALKDAAVDKVDAAQVAVSEVAESVGDRVGEIREVGRSALEKKDQEAMAIESVKELDQVLIDYEAEAKVLEAKLDETITSVSRDSNHVWEDLNRTSEIASVENQLLNDTAWD